MVILTHLPESGTTRNSLNIEKFGLNSEILISNCNVTADLSNPEQLVRGFNFIGGNVGSNTQITIHQSQFNLIGQWITGIRFTGLFPEDSFIDIFDNDFRVTSFNTMSRGIAIHARNGEKNNISIVENDFTTANNSGSEAGIFS